jgi:microsomal dipeptidase-like Zn-dependent dipeptidase
MKQQRKLSALVASFVFLAISHMEPDVSQAALVEPRQEPPLHGFADLHNHMMSHLAFGGTLIGGKPFAPDVFREPDALRSAIPGCAAEHGVNPASLLPLIPNSTCGDIIGNAASGLGFLGFLGCHGTKGYPTFEDWPRWNSVTHQQNYYKWLERAYQGGLRLLVIHTVDNLMMCQLLKVAGALDSLLLFVTGHPLAAFLSAPYLPPKFNCDEMASVDRQIDAVFQLQNYIDSLNGGPGMGWFRIALSGKQAREIIKSGKLAVVLGIEVSDLFHCTNQSSCSNDTLLEQLRIYRGRGIRHIFPMHEFNNGFGGTALFRSPLVIANDYFLPEHPNVVVRDCSAQGYTFKLPRTRAGFVERLYMDIFELLDQALDFLPGFDLGSFEFPDFPACNDTGLSLLGQSLIRKMMSRKIMIDIDHMSARAKDGTLFFAEERGYPAIVASHTHFPEISLGHKGHEFSLRADQIERIRALGGSIGIILWQDELAANVPYPDDAPHDCGHSSEMFAHSYRYAVDGLGGNAVAAVALGDDMTGFARSVAPRFGEDRCDGDTEGPALQARVSYPFPLYFKPGTTMGRHTVGERTFDVNLDGVAQIGMLPDFIRDLEVQGVDVAPLFRSAEQYVKMWELADSLNLSPPSSTSTQSPRANRFGWNNGDVTITITGVQSEADGLTPEEMQIGGSIQLTGANLIELQPIFDSPLILPINNQGTTTVTFYVVDKAGNRQVTPKQHVVRIDKTLPTVTLSTNKKSYLVSDRVTISCSATDALSGLVSSTLTATNSLGSTVSSSACGNQIAPASNFSLGTNTLTATARDTADNVRQLSVSFGVSAQQPSLCELGREFFTDSDVSDALCSMLEEIKTAKDSNNFTLRDQLLDEYASTVSEYAGAEITAEQAETLIRWVGDWALLCAGDCGQDHATTVDDLIRAVNVALGNADVVECVPSDLNVDGLVTVDELVRSVNAALIGC